MAMLLQRAKHGADALTETQALEMAPLEGAKALGRDDIGALKPGMAAHFVGFKPNQRAFAGALQDPVAALVFCTPGQVSFSVVNGQVIARDGQNPGLDLAALIAHLNRLAAEIVSRTEKKYGHDFTTKVWRREGEK